VGVSICWLAFRNKPKDTILAEAGFVDTCEPDFGYPSPASAAALPSGWYLIVLNQFTPPISRAKVLSQLSAACQIAVCQAEEHVMASAASFYEDGNRRWAVTHEAEKGLYDLDIIGNAPDISLELRERAIRKQDANDKIKLGEVTFDVDYFFDVPIDLIDSICGYRHDRAEFDWGKPAFTRLEKA
jgi:hypothetical protein